MELSDFVKDKKYTPSQDLVMPDGQIAFREGRGYYCSRVTEDFVVLDSDLGRWRIGGFGSGPEWHQYFSPYEPRSRDIEYVLSDLYDAMQDGTVTKDLLEEYRDITGKDRPGFMQ